MYASTYSLFPLQASLAPLANPQLARINELYNLLSNSSSSDYLKRGEEPILEGLTPTLDLTLFREAQERTRGHWYVQDGLSTATDS